jgi:large subunit ribosomal protein L30
MSNKKDKGHITVTLIRSAFGRIPRHRAIIKGLGLSKIRQTVVLEDTPSIRGMIEKVRYVLRVEEE